MFRSHLSDDGVAMPTGTDASLVNQVTDGVIRGLSTPPQALPTNGTEPLATPNNTPIPTNPASPISFDSIQPLAVLATRVLDAPAPPPAPAPGMATGAKIALGAVAILAIGYMLKHK